LTWPVLEGIFLQIGLFILLNFYANYSGILYDQYSTNVAMVIYSTLWVFFLWVFGGYDKPWIPRRVLRGILAGSIVLIAGYGLLPEDLRFSRAILLLGAVWFSAIVIIGRVTLGGWRLGAKPKSRLIVAGKDESLSIKQLLESIELREGIADATTVITPNELSTIVDVVRVHSIGEIVFSGRDVRSEDIITVLASLVDRSVVCRIAWTDDGYVMGSGGPGPDPVTELDRAIFGPSARRSKRIFDLFSSLILLLAFPLLVVFRRSGWITYSFQVFLGKSTWVGLDGIHKQSRPSIIYAVKNDDDRVRERLNLAYARKYNWLEDLKLVMNALLLQSVN